MKARALSIMTAALAVIAMLSALDLSGLINLIPGGNEGLVALITGALATLGTIIRAIGDWLDDGEVNNSFGRLRMHWLTFLAACVIAALGAMSIGCADLAGTSISLQSPWGSVESRDGATIIHPMPIIIPGK